MTSEFVDLKIRLENNRAYLDQYRQLLKRAKSMKDILDIQEKARRLESEIDSQLGRMKYINDQVKYSTLTLNVYQEYVKKNVYKSPSYMARIGNSAKYGFNGFQELILWGIVLWPFWLLLIFLYFIRKIYKNRSKKS